MARTNEQMDWHPWPIQPPVHFTPTPPSQRRVPPLIQGIAQAERHEQETAAVQVNPSWCADLVEWLLAC